MSTASADSSPHNYILSSHYIPIQITSQPSVYKHAAFHRKVLQLPTTPYSFFRFVVLRPGQLSSPIEVNILQTTLRHNLPFEALSYTWSDHSKLRKILVRGQKRRFLHITGNLESALQHLRYPGKTRLIGSMHCASTKETAMRGALK